MASHLGREINFTERGLIISWVQVYIASFESWLYRIKSWQMILCISHIHGHSPRGVMGIYWWFLAMCPKFQSSRWPSQVQQMSKCQTSECHEDHREKRETNLNSRCTIRPQQSLQEEQKTNQPILLGYKRFVTANITTKRVEIQNK